ALLRTRKEKAGGAFAALAQYVPGTNAAQYRDAQDLATQTVGYLLEGGKMTDNDRAYYRSLMPTAADSDERAKAKVENLKQLLYLKASGQLEGLGRAGFNTSALQGLVQAPMNAGQRRDAALAWAKANPNDPKAQELMALLGASGG